MKQYSRFFRLTAVLLAFCLFTVCMQPAHYAFAEDSDYYTEDYESMTAEEKQAYLEQKLKEVNEKLNDLGEQSKETEEYIDTLDQKIKYLQQEMQISKQKIEDSQERIVTLEKQKQENELLIKQLNDDIKQLEEKSVLLEAQFVNNYEQFCKRARAMYISGDMSVLSMLLTSGDISTLLTRYEMIKRVSQSDKMLLQTVQSEAQELSETKASVEEKQQSLIENQSVLEKTQESLASTVSYLETQQTDYQKKQSAYENQKSESDELLKKLHDEEQAYSEYRNQDQAELEAVNAEIAAAAEEFKKKLEAQTTTAATTTTQPESDDEEDGETTDTTAPTETTTTATTQNSAKLSMTYPVPSQTKITCDFGSAGYVGHTGVDFSCPSGSQVVAAESGYVFYTKELNYSYGYHVVIMHDKTDSAGNYVYTLYAHNSSIVVSAGQYVTKGQLIAYSGSTGNSTGPHCHFEVRTPSANYSDCVNPNFYLP